jgi:hypothetical protein
MDDMELPDRSLRLFMTAWLEGVRVMVMRGFGVGIGAS